MTRAIYPGSFDPFTNGHLSIVKEAAEIFDEVIVLIANNPDKKRMFTIEEMQKAIKEVLAENNIVNCRVIIHDGLVADYAAENNIKYMIRGLRNNIDYNYEENIANINQLIYPELKYVYFRAENAAISSSMVKELYKYGKGVAAFVPAKIYTLFFRETKKSLNHTL